MHDILTIGKNQKLINLFRYVLEFIPSRNHLTDRRSPDVGSECVVIQASLPEMRWKFAYGHMARVSRETGAIAEDPATAGCGNQAAIKQTGLPMKVQQLVRGLVAQIAAAF